MLRQDKIKIQCQDLTSCFTCILQDSRIIVDITNLKFHQSALADTEKISWAPKLQIFSGYIKSIIGFIEDLQTFRSIFFIISLDKNAVRLMLSTPYTPEANASMILFFSFGFIFP